MKRIRAFLAGWMPKVKSDPLRGPDGRFLSTERQLVRARARDMRKSMGMRPDPRLKERELKL